MPWKRILPIKYRPMLICFGVALLCFAAWLFILPTPLFQVPYSTVLLDREGKIIGVKAAGDGQIRFQASGQLPVRYMISVMAFEDGWFMCHQGVNWGALLRALWQNIRAGQVVSGGSTLSMQVIRLAFKNPPRTIPQKIKEIVFTLRLEQEYTKEQIFRMYASHAPFGGNIVGIQAASLKYFNRKPEQLSWAEAALLAVLPNAPSLIYPGKNNAALKQKRDKLLEKLYRQGEISRDTYHLALAEPLPRRMNEEECVAPHLLVRACLERKGEVCRSYIDSRLQKKVNEIVERHTDLLSRNYIYNMAVLVAHVPDGEVLAYAGNSASRPGSRGNEVDIIKAARSSGSILKPLLYALMLQDGAILPHTLVPDIPSRFGNYAPSNFNRDFKGAVRASVALSQSLNIPFVRMLNEYTYTRFYDDLKGLGMTTLYQDPGHYGLSLILGGAETSLWDICNIYGGMASVLRHYDEEDGQYFQGEYQCLSLWDRSLTSSPKPKKGKGELQAAAIWQTLQALENVERPEMESGWKNFVSSMNLSWKTGTSFGFRDAWAVGVNPDYVIGVWVGNADGEGRPGLVGVRAAAPVLFEVAAQLRSDHRFYEPAEEMEQVVVCHQSGYRASMYCEETDTIKVCRAGLRTGLCPFHHLINLDASGEWQVNSDCEPVSRIQVKSWFILPPVQEWYYCRTHTGYRRLPPFRPDCRGKNADWMDMIYPRQGTRVFIPRDFDQKPQKVILEAVHRLSGANIYWHVDDQYLGITHGIHQMEVFLNEGRHRLTLVDEEGNQLQQVFRVVGK